MQQVGNYNKIPDMNLHGETLQAVSVLQPFRHSKSGFIIMEIWKNIDEFNGRYEV